MADYNPRRITRKAARSAMTEIPEDTRAVLECAAKVAPQVLPAGVGDAAATLFDLLRQWPGVPSTVVAGGTSLAREVLALAEQQQTRPFQVGDEVHWRWHGDGGSGKWFKARLVEHRPAGYPKGWAGAITDQGTFYAGDYAWQCPVGHIVFLDEPSMTLVTEGGQ